MMQELIWYIECYGNWVLGGFIAGYVACLFAFIQKQESRQVNDNQMG